MLKKKRANIDAIAAPSILLLVLYSILASATLVDGTVLPREIVSGLMTPENLMNSVPLSKPTCFSPLTTKFHFVNTSTTVAVKDPLNTFLALAAASSV
jgi:hypothetical protein